MKKLYIGTKIISACPQSKDGKPGYAVTYEDGYVSWSPKDVFECAYRVVDGDCPRLTFGDAIHMMKAGKKVARAGWNGKGMWLQLVIPHSNRAPQTPTAMVLSLPDDVDTLPWIGMKTADNKFVPWLASQTDMLAEDWTVV